jgi:hypothetical protein
MCGLVGVAGKLSPKDEDLMAKMFMLDFFRGPDATGLAAIRNNGEVKVAKLASDPVTLFGMHGFKEALCGNISRAFIGHNRWATRGGKTHYNAHPFECEHIIGAHNGTLDTASWDRLEEALGQKFGVDSHALIAAIAKLGIKDTIELCNHGNDSTTGAWSLVWYDLFEGTINFLRNEHRPMWLAYNKDKDGYDRIFWASEWPMIDAAVRLSKVPYDQYKDKDGFGFFPTDVDVHYKFDVGLFLTSSEKAIKPKVKTIKGRELVKVVAPASDDPFGRITGTCGFHSTSTQPRNNPSSTTNGTRTRERSSRGTTQPSVLNWMGTVKHPLAGHMTHEQFNNMAQVSGGASCQWCDRGLDISEPGMTIIERDSMLLCGPCSGHTNINDNTPTRILVPSAEFIKLSQG